MHSFRNSNQPPRRIGQHISYRKSFDGTFWYRYSLLLLSIIDTTDDELKAGRKGDWAWGNTVSRTLPEIFQKPPWPIIDRSTGLLILPPRVHCCAFLKQYFFE